MAGKLIFRHTAIEKGNKAAYTDSPSLGYWCALGQNKTNYGIVVQKIRFFRRHKDVMMVSDKKLELVLTGQSG